MIDEEAVKRALALIRKRSANYEYFFSKLDSADWIDPLDREGLFSSPPPALRRENGVNFPVWPELGFLIRVAADAPEKVSRVMMKIPETDNIRVHADLALAASKLPGPLAAKWAQKEIIWIRKQEWLYFLPSALGDLMSHLVQSKEIKMGMELAKSVLAVELVDAHSGNVSSRVDTWQYERTIKKHFQEIVRWDGERALKLLCKLLTDATAAETSESRGHSYLWRPAVEPHPQNFGAPDVRAVLVEAIRELSTQLIQAGVRLQSLIETILAYNRGILTRVVLHLLVDNCEQSAAREFVLCRQNFFNIELLHEYSRLLAAVFPGLDENSRSTILGWIDEGPLHLVAEGDEDPDLRQNKKAYWQAQRLWLLRGRLPAEWESRLNETVSKLGEPEHPDFVVYTTTWMGPTSPKEIEDLEGMSVKQIAAFLRDWSPTDSGPAPSVEGLGRALQVTVAKSPDRFVATLESFYGLEPTYSRAITQGFKDAVKAGRPLDWPAVVKYLAWIGEQPRSEVVVADDRLDRDLHWGWARLEVVNLLSEGFKANLIDFALREEVWMIVNAIADDPSPTEEDDKEDSMDPATRSINTVRGTALHAVVRYALWVRRELSQGQNQLEPSDFDMTSVREVKDRLEWHLDLNNETSPAIRSVYGQWFPWLFALDANWAGLSVPLIFPSSCPELCDAAWHTYLALCNPYTDVFEVLRGQYSDSIDRMSRKEDPANSLERPSSKIGEHLLAMVGSGVIAWDDGDGLLKRYFEKAAVSAASQALAYAGQLLEIDRVSASRDVAERFRKFWESLKGHVLASGGDRVDMLKSFGWWFVSGCFDAEWSLGQLEQVIKTTRFVQPDHQVAEKLGELAGNYPKQSLEILKEMIVRVEDSWAVQGWRSSIETVVQEALRVEATRADATAFIHHLGARGYATFRQFL